MTDNYAQVMRNHVNNFQGENPILMKSVDKFAVIHIVLLKKSDINTVIDEVFHIIHIF